MHGQHVFRGCPRRSRRVRSRRGARRAPAPADGSSAAPPGEKTEKQLKREAEKKAKKAAEAAKKAAKLEARQVRGQSGNTVTVGVVPNPPVDLEPASGTRDSYPEEMRLTLRPEMTPTLARMILKAWATAS